MATQASVSALLLRHARVFAGLPGDQLALLASVAVRRNYPRGTTIIAAGELSDCLYIVLSGTLKIAMSDQVNGHEVILSTLGPGEHFGEMTAIDDEASPASVVSVGPCELLMLSNLEFRRCLSENPEMTMTVMRCLVGRLREANRKISSLALMDVHGRVAHLLVEMAETVDGRHVVPVNAAKKKYIAKMIGASREMVTRAMKDLYLGGFIEVRGNAIYLCDNIMTIS